MSRPRPSIQIPDSEALTQFGTATHGFRKRPLEGERELSMLLGLLTPTGAVACISKAAMAFPQRDGVRHSTAGKLRTAGFTVESTPEKANPLHVSISVDKEWEEEEESSFEQCMSEPIWEAEGGSDE